MAFDIASAQPVKFDLGSAKPVTAQGKSETYSPTEGYSNTLNVAGIDTGIPIPQGVENFLAGAGKATVDLGRGAGQMLGLVSRQDVADSRARDTALMATGTGKAGNVTGTVADMLPAAFIPGAATLGGAAAIGAGSGLVQPSTGTGETALNTGLGALTGPASLLVGRGLGALYQGGKAAIEPFFKGGQDRIAGRTLQAFAGGDQPLQTAVHALTNPPAILPGVQPMSAELANNAGLSQLERSLRNNPEYLTALTNRNQANRGAMTGAIQGIAGTDADVAAAQAARTQAASPLYQAARSATVPADANLGALLARPSMKTAWARAEGLAAENGETLTGAHANDITGKTLQYLKMSLNDIAGAGPQSGMGAHEVRAVKSTLGALNDWIQSNVPALKAADAAYAKASAPLNQMEVGTALSNRLQPALADFGNNTRLNANSFAQAVRGGDQLAANATGRTGATLQDVMTPEQLTTIRQVGEQLARRANADELGRAVGSNTAQNLVSQNVLRQMLGPLGLPQSMGERAAQSTLGQSILRPMQWAAQAGEPRVMDKLAQAALDPKVAAGLLRMKSSNKAAQMIWARQGLLGPIGQTAIGGLLAPSANAAQQ